MNKKLLLALVLITLVVTGTVYAQVAETRPSFFQTLFSWLWPASPATTQVAAVASTAKPATPNPLIADLRAAADKAKGPGKVDPTKPPANPNKLTIKAGSKKTTNKTGAVISGRTSSGVTPATPVLEITQISGPSLVFTNQDNSWYSWTNTNTVTSASVDWGDGTQTSGQVNPWGVAFRHVYAHSGTYTATFYSSDVDGNQAQASVSVSVTGAPTVSAQANPTLALSYNSQQQESSLTATYNVDITAGAEDVVLPVGSLVYVYPYLESNNCSIPGLSEYHYCSAGVSGTPTTTPSVSNGLTIPAGTTKTLRVDARFNPQTLFSGSYVSTLWGINFCGSSTGWCQWVQLVQPVSTNSLTVFGERAPYITSATVLGCLPPAEKCYLQITGTRFATSGNTVKVYNRRTGALVSQTNENPVAGGDGSIIYHSMIEPVSGRPYPAGFYSVQLISPNTGASNMVGFEMVEVAPVNPLTLTSPNGGEIWKSGTTQRIGWSWPTDEFSGQPFSIFLTPQNWSPSNPQLIIATGLTGTSYYDWNVGLTKGDVMAPSQNYSISICANSNTFGGQICDKSDNYFTITSNLTPTPAPSTLSVLLPRGGEVWPIGSTKEINWSETNYTYSPGLYKIYASTRDGSWYGLINQTGEPSINWQVGKVTVNGVTKTLSPGNYWIQVIKQDNCVSSSGVACRQAFSLGSVELTGTATTPSVPTPPVNPVPTVPAVPAPTPTVPVVPPTPTPPAPIPVPAPPAPVSAISIRSPRTGDSWRLGEQRNIEWQDSRPGNYSYTVYIATPSDGANRVNLRQIAVVNEKKLRWTVGQNLTANPVTAGSYVIVVVSTTNPEYNSAVSTPFNITANHAYLSGGNQTASASDSLGGWLYGMFPDLFSY